MVLIFYHKPRRDALRFRLRQIDGRCAIRSGFSGGVGDPLAKLSPLPALDKARHDRL
jgi:hypothetical protein